MTREAVPLPPQVYTRLHLRQELHGSGILQHAGDCAGQRLPAPAGPHADLQLSAAWIAVAVAGGSPRLLLAVDADALQEVVPLQPADMGAVHW